MLDLPVPLGILRRLSQLANERGVFTITALDHRGSLAKKLSPDNPEGASYEEMRELKLQLARAFAPHSSALLLDPEYGAAAAIASGALPGKVGLLVSLEATGYTGDGTARRTQVLEGWSVEKISRLGAQAVKLLLYYHPDGGDLSRRQEELVRGAAEDCRRLQLPLLVEPMSYSLDPGVKKQSAEFARQKPEIVIETARRLAPLGMHVLKMEFPADPNFEQDEGRMEAWCRELSDACGMPWVLLSAGEVYDVFRRQVEIACASGASGFLAGRAIWQELTDLPAGRERQRFLAEVAVPRLQALGQIAGGSARPWREAYGIGDGEGVPEGWYREF